MCAEDSQKATDCSLHKLTHHTQCPAADGAYQSYMTAKLKLTSGLCRKPSQACQWGCAQEMPTHLVSHPLSRQPLVHDAVMRSECDVYTGGMCAEFLRRPRSIPCRGLRMKRISGD